MCVWHTEAMMHGLVSKVVPDDQLQTEVS